MKPDKKEGREKSHIFLCNDTINRINSSIICSLSVTKMTLDRLNYQRREPKVITATITQEGTLRSKETIQMMSTILA